MSGIDPEDSVQASDELRRVSIRKAVWPDDLPAARRLLTAYQQDLLGRVPLGPHHDAFAQEIARLHNLWQEPASVLLLAVKDGQPAGCVGVRKTAGRENSLELKRLWTDPEARGFGIGQSLVRAAIAWAREHGAAELLLDTVPAVQPEAGRLYRKLGFLPYVNYNENPVADAAFFRLDLHGS